MQWKQLGLLNCSYIIVECVTVDICDMRFRDGNESVMAIKCNHVHFLTSVLTYNVLTVDIT